MKITCLVENTSIDENVRAQHGLSLYIETGDKKILFDMGQDDLFWQNAKAMGIDLSGVDFAVISHGHYDHGGGLGVFLDINKTAPVYLNEHAFEPHYNGEKHPGLDTTLKNNERLIFCGDKHQIDDGICLYSCNDHTKQFDFIASGLTLKEDGEEKPEDFRHEQYMLIKENDRRILFSACSHKGIMDIASWFMPDVLIGGFHFSKLPTDENMAHNALFLSKFDTEFITCHCTGVEQYKFMKQSMEKLSYLSAGKTVEII